MKHLKLFSIAFIAIIACAIFSASCSSKIYTIQGSYPIKNSIETETTFDKVWNNVIDFFAENNIPIATLEKESGIIVASNVNIDERSISREDENGKIINSNAWFVAPYSPSKNPSTPKVSCTFNVRVRAMESGKTYISVNVSNISAITTIAQFNPHTFITTYRDVATQCEPTGKFENDLLNLFR